MSVALAAAAALLFAVALLLARLAIGPSLHDRVLAAHAIALSAVLCAAAFAVAVGEAAWLDAAIAFVCVDFIAGVGFLKFLRQRSLQAPLARAGALDA